MPRPLSLLPALAAVAAVAGSLLAGVAPATAAPLPEDTDPLQITIDSLTPGEIPERGPVRMRGTVTNLSEERWRAVNVYAFVGYEPMTSTAELEQAREVPAAAEVGQRILDPGTFDGLGSLDPGESAPYEIVLRRNEIPAEESGVYWFGAHALGNTDEVRDGVADGRARTFLPLLPEGGPGSGRDSGPDSRVDTALVVPLRRQVQHTRSGKLAGESGWATDLGANGYLRRLVDLGNAAGRRPFGWLVDPAVVDAAERLVDGNSPRSLADTVTPPEPDESASPGQESASPSEDPSASPPEDPPAPGIAGGAAEAWLARLDDALEGGRVLSLPYGDIDVSAADAHAAALLRQARSRAGDRLPTPGVPTVPAVAPPNGYLAPDTIADLPDGTHTLLGDRMLPEEASDGPLDVEGRRVLFAATDVAAGGPGPDDPLGAVAVRQRILAEAAVRRLEQPDTPLVVALPQTWAPERPRAFWRGMSVSWLRFADPTSLVSDEQVSPDDLDYPAEQQEQELPATSFDTAERLVGAGRLLVSLLTNNDRVDAEVADEALSSVSYGARRNPGRAQQRDQESLAWIERRTGAVQVSAPRGVTLSSAAGRFAITVSNRLPHPVTVSLDAVSDGALTVDTPPTIDLAPRSSLGVELGARASTPGVHYVQLVVTDDGGAPLGSSARLPVRSAQVSQVIWVILGVGVGLLFLAIAVRLLRRVRNERG